MAYEKQTWVDGVTPLDAEHLNHMEQGISQLSEEIVTTAESKVAAHNTGTDTHSDIRLLIQGLTDRLNALADSDDTTLDQLSEVVAYIKSNRELISSITTDKVSVAHIVDNLTTNVANKPLSAAQGVALKELIDAISVPDKLPNPNALTFTGAVTGSYDGSEPLEVVIPSGGGGEVGNDTYELAATIEIAESVQSINQNFSKSYKEIYVFFEKIKTSVNCQLVINDLPSANGWVTTNAGYKAARLFHRNGIGIERQDSDHATYGFWQGANISRRFDFNTDADFESIKISTSNPITATMESGTIRIYGR